MKGPFFKVFRFGGYPFDVAVTCGLERKALERKLRKINGLADDEELADFTSMGRTTELPNGPLLIQLRHMPDTPFNLSILIHEIFHAVTFLMSRIGVNLSDDSDEAFAYAMQDLTEKIVAAFNQTKKRR